ncbi:hypothetical protein X738_23080 [Mesorhizobium sp. LNHC209A00]|nr:hypothetical protein X738_23080 [Mesorhizobium sp. LNHC209A00]
MQFHRFMRADEFVRELAPLHAFRSEYMGTSLLEGLESASLLFPRIRLRYPDPVARRLWLEMHEDMPCQLKHPLEPDGARWDSAVDFRNRLHRWQNYIVYGISPHPLDDYEPRFTEFVQRPKDFSFERRLDRRVDVSSDVYETLFDDCNVEDYYSSWQLLFAAELADAGIHMRINLADRNIARAAEKAIHQGRIPAGTSSAFNFLPAHAARNFASHEKALDAVVWFAEERSRMLSKITTQHGGGRFRLSPAEGAQYEQAGQDLALASAKRFSIGGNDLETLIRPNCETELEGLAEGSNRSLT